MNRHFITALLFVLLALSVRTAQADDETSLRLLTKWMQKAQTFESEYTREKVYLHLDNNAYFEGETMWFKAYVMRAANLHASTELSRVLYVDLIDDEGEMVEHKLLRIDDNGQAEGEIDLKLPINSGYYEVRAYTRAMTNWSPDACFSRVVPIFRAQDKDADPADLYIAVPNDEQDMPFGHRRPMATGSRKNISVQFFPEGGNRVAGEEQRVAFKVFNGRGNALATTMQIKRADGSVVATSTTDKEGMGLFTLPAGLPADEQLVAVPMTFAADGDSKQTFALPAVDPAARYVLRVDPEADEVKVNIRSSAAAKPQLLGLLVSCRAQPTYFDTLTIYRDDNLQLALPRDVMRSGVNCIDLFDESGHSLCRRLVWNASPSDRTLQLSVRQNEKTYEAFAPVALEMELADKGGAPVGDATFSVSVRNADADVVATPAVDMATELLLSSELRGYVSHPERYFAADDEAHRSALDLLLMVQGWSADDFETMAGVQPFTLRQPMEDKLIMRGQVFRDNDKHKPWPGLDLHLQMYSLEGASLAGDVTTDKNGCFAFKSNVDFCGEWYAQITTKESTTDRHGNEKEKRRWSRVTLDRWFEPALRPLSSAELVLEAPKAASEAKLIAEQELFVWEDTIPRVMHQELGEAVVKDRGKYRGLVGNRYSYNGGEEAGLRHSSLYINVERENERRKDEGRGEGTLLEILGEATQRTVGLRKAYEMNSKKKPASSSADDDKATDLKSLHSTADLDVTASVDVPLNNGDYVELKGEHYWYYDGVYVANNAPAANINNRPCIFFLNNDLVGYGYDTSQIIEEDDMASEFKSAIIMTERKDWMAFWPVGRNTNCPKDEDPYYNGKPYYGVFLYNREQPFRFYTKKGVDKRTVQGYSVPRKFYQPQYNGIEVPSYTDCRRTLCWRPSLTTDADGKASLVFFNSADAQRIAISVRGVTSDGRFIYYER